jgi:hypothetical protein
MVENSKLDYQIFIVNLLKNESLFNLINERND